MRRLLLLTFVMLLSMNMLAQLEVKEDSFKEVTGFVNINTEKMYDDNDKPYAVLKIKTENINDKQRREFLFQGDARTFFEIEYKVGEVWLYISYYASYIKISHPDLSSTEFWFPFDMEPKKGYELTLINKPSVDEEILNRLERLEGAYVNVNAVQSAQQSGEFGYITVKSTPSGANVSVDNNVVGATPYLAEIIGAGNHRISVELEGYEPDAKIVNIVLGEEQRIEFTLVKNNINEVPKKEIYRDTTPTKILHGKFSVSKNRQVCFSQGNLQYRPASKTWRFAENQWDFIGEKNLNASPQYNSWMDLFLYGTSGYSEFYPPYLTKSTSLVTIDFDICGTNYDWGIYNEIANGGGTVYNWRTLTKDEWEYIFNH